MLFMSLDLVASLLLWGGQLYRIPEIVPTIVPPKQCHKVISHTAKFNLFTIRSEGEQNDTATSSQDLSIKQKRIDKIVDEYQDVLTAPTWVPPHCLIKKGYNITRHTLSSTPSFRFSRSLSVSQENLTQWGPLLPKGEE
jgi:hypothetical protein